MKVPRVVKAMEYIDDELVTAAEAYKPKKKKLAWMKWGAMAACLCLVIVGAITLFLGQQTSLPVYGALAEVTKVLGDNQFEAVITGEDENFSKNDMVTVTYENTEESTIAIGDTVAITYSEFEKTNTETAFTVNLGGNTSFQKKIILTSTTPYWAITIDNTGDASVIIELGGKVYRVETGTKDTIRADEKLEPGTYTVSFASAGASKMYGTAVCVLSGSPEEDVPYKISAGQIEIVSTD